MPIIIEIDLENPQFSGDDFLLAKLIDISRFTYKDQPPMKYGIIDPDDPSLIILTSRYSFEMIDIGRGYYA